MHRAHGCVTALSGMLQLRSGSIPIELALTIALIIQPSHHAVLSETIAQVHARGLKFGIWVGHSICADTDDLGSHSNGASGPDFASLDATLLASMGVDAVKHDNCVTVANTTAAREANYDRYMRFGRALNASGRPMLYDVVMQVDDNSWPAVTPHYSYGSVWSPETYGKERIRALAHMWWSLPCNKYNVWSACVGPSMKIVNASVCNDATGSNPRGALRGILPMLDSQTLGRPGFSKEGHFDYGFAGGWNHLDQLAVRLPLSPSVSFDHLKFLFVLN